MNLIHLRTSFLLPAVCIPMLADILVVPNSQTTAAGNTSLNNNGKPGHLQEIIGGGQFPLAGAITIYAARLRSFPGSGPVTSPKTAFKITMSTTQAYPNTANGHALPSLTFANNFGPDATVVFNDAIALSSPGCLSPGPCPLDMVIPFAVPFSYDSSKGRLLIDVVFGGGTGNSGSFDGQVFPDFSSSSVALLITNDPTQPAAPEVNSGGFVFGIEYAGSAPPYSFVIPRSLASADGDSSSTTSGLFGTAAATVQFQITAAEIAALGINTGDQITGVQTRLEGGQSTGPAAPVQIANLDITLAQAAMPFASISNTYANNLKSPVMVRSGPLPFPRIRCQAGPHRAHRTPSECWYRSRLPTRIRAET